VITKVSGLHHDQTRNRWSVRWVGDDGKGHSFSRADRRTVESKRAELLDQSRAKGEAGDALAELLDLGEFDGRPDWWSKALTTTTKAMHAATMARDHGTLNLLSKYQRGLVDLSKSAAFYSDYEALIREFERLIEFFEDVYKQARFGWWAGIEPIPAIAYGAGLTEKLDEQGRPMEPVFDRWGRLVEYRPHGSIIPPSNVPGIPETLDTPEGSEPLYDALDARICPARTLCGGELNPPDREKPN
jgi:hypothetical protein